MKRLPVVAIIGKPNVGKSTLFNRIVKSRKAITHPSPGVTRDRMDERVRWNDVDFVIVDTGGFHMDGSTPLQGEIFDRIKQSAAEATVIIFLVDIDTGPTDEDESLLQVLKSEREKMILVVNKVESNEDKWSTHEFYRLGFQDIHTVSALHGTGVADMLDKLVSLLPRKTVGEVTSELRISIVGKPNVGKSSLVNALIGKEKHIVSEIPGTTRDAISLRLKYHGKDLVLIDTAGIKRRARTEKGLSTISSLKSLKSIKIADIVLVVIDASESISYQDTKIAAAAHKARKGIIVLLNKWDLVEKERGILEKYAKDVRKSMPFLSYSPVLSVSALTGQRISKIFSLCIEVQSQRQKRIQTTELNRLIKDAVSDNPPRFYKGGTGKIFYATQTDVKPPTFTLFVNKSSYFPRSYIRYINNRVRKMFTFSGTAVKISLRSKERRS